MTTNVIDQLKERGLIAQLTDEPGLRKKLNEGPIALYCGFDPTADSLHLGHLVPLLCLKRFQEAGNTPVALVGGATGLIGDPSFKATERKLNSKETVAAWVEKIKAQVSPFLDFAQKHNAAKIVNNHDWFGDLNVLSFLRDIGKYFSINAMISKEAVKQRIDRNELGISYTEFSYNLLQAYDFAALNKEHNVMLQIGGSDQWGNITSGIDLVRRLNQQQAYGLTVPLITKSDGTKFGKTESGAIWLDPKRTSIYAFYQFWLNTADSDVYQFLKFFTFLPIDEIQHIEKTDKALPKPKAQTILANEVTALVHGEFGLSAAKRITGSLFSGQLEKLTDQDFMQLAQDGIPSVAVESGIDVAEALVATKLAPSRGQARTLLESNAITINGNKQTKADATFGKDDILFGRYSLLRRGKKNYCLLCWK